MDQQVQHSREPAFCELQTNLAFVKNVVSGNEGLASWEKVHYYRGQQKEFLDAILEM